MLKVIIFRTGFKIANFTLVFIFYNFVRYFKMTIETDFSKKSSRTFFTFILRSIKMMIQMGLMLIWRPSNPRAEKAFYNHMLTFSFRIAPKDIGSSNTSPSSSIEFSVLKTLRTFFQIFSFL